MFGLHMLHALNDGMEASYILFLPFIAQSLHLTQFHIGITGSILFGLAVLCSLPASYLAERFGGLRTLIISGMMYGLGFFLLATSSHLFHVGLAFTLGGIAFGLFHPIAFALVARSAQSSERGAHMGRFTTTGELGRMGIATALSVIVALIGWRFTAVFYGFITGIICLMFARNMSFSKEMFQATRSISPSISHLHILKNTRFVLAISINMLDNVASQMVLLFFPFLLLFRGIEPVSIGLYSGALFAGSLAGRIYFGKGADRFGSNQTFIFAESIMIIGIVVLASFSQPAVILPVAFVLGIFTKGTAPLIKTIISETVSHHGNYEKTFSLNSFTASIASMVAPLFFGYISQTFGIMYVFYTMAFFGGLAVIPSVVLLTLRK